MKTDNVVKKYQSEYISDILDFRKLDDFKHNAQYSEKDIYEFIYMFKTDLYKIKALSYLKSDYYIGQIIISLKDDKNKISCLKYVESEYEKKEIVCSISDDDFRVSFLYNLTKLENCIEVMAGIKNSEALKIAQNIMQEEDTLFNRLLHLPNDLEKIKHINRLRLEDNKIDVLATIKDISLVVEYIDNFEYDFTKIKVINKIYDDSDKIKFLDKLNDEFSCAQVIANFKSDELKLKFLGLFKEDTSKVVILCSLKKDELKLKYLNILDESFQNEVFLSLKSLNYKLESLGISYKNIELKPFTYFLEYVYEDKWNTILKSQDSIYLNMRQKMTKYLENNSFKEFLVNYEEELKMIASILTTDINSIKEMFENYKKNPKGNYSNIENLINTFLIKSRDIYIRSNVLTKLKEIKSKYLKQSEVDIKNYLISEKKKIKFAKEYLKDDLLMEVKSLVNVNFESDNINYQELVKHILLGNTEEAVNYLNINKPYHYEHYKAFKAYKRLVCNYLPILQKLGVKNHSLLMNYYADTISYQAVTEKFDSKTSKMLKDSKDLFLESNSTLVVNNNELEFINNYSFLDEQDIFVIKQYEEQLKDLKRLSSDIFKIYKKYESKIKIVILKEDIKAYESKAPIRYDLNIYNLDQNNCYKIFLKIFSRRNLTFNQFDEETLKAYKKLFIDGNIYLLYFMLPDLEPIYFESLLDNFDVLMKNTEHKNICIQNVKSLLNSAGVLGYVSPNDINILSYDLLKKILFKETYITKIDQAARKNRVRMAIQYHLLAYGKTKSTIPYIKSSFEGFTAERFNNNDPEILASGIDTEACTRIMGADNDFFAYTLLNKNGIVLKICDEDGNFIGKCSGFRNGNILYLNELRSIWDERGTGLTKNNSNMYYQLQNIVSKWCYDLLESPENQIEPIEHIFILEAYAFCHNHNLKTIKRQELPMPLMNTKYNDWKEYRETTPDLQQAENHFTTDIDTFHPPLLIASLSDYLSINNYKNFDPETRFERPRQNVTRFNVLNEDNISAIMKINALQNEYKKENNDLFQDISKECVDFILLGEDWFYILLKSGKDISIILPFDERATAEFERFVKSNCFTNDTQLRSP